MFKSRYILSHFFGKIKKNTPKDIFSLFGVSILYYLFSLTACFLSFPFLLIDAKMLAQYIIKMIPAIKFTTLKFRMLTTPAIIPIIGPAFFLSNDKSEAKRS